MFKNWSIRYKVMLIAFVAITGFIVYLTSNIYVALDTDSSLGEIQNENFPVLGIINESSITLNFVKQSLADAVSTGEIESVESARELYDEIFKELDRMKELSPSVAEEAVRLQGLLTTYFDASSRVATGMMDDSLAPEEMMALFPKINSSFADLETGFNEFRKIQTDSFSSALLDTITKSEAAWQRGVMLAAGLIALLFAISYIITKTLTNGLNHAVKIADQIAEGDWQVDIDVNSTDEIGHLLSAISTMRDRLKERTDEDHRKERIQSQVAELNEQMRGDLTLIELCRKVLDYLTPTLNCQIAAVYLYDSDEEQATMVGSYAFKNRKGVTNAFKLGESLVGQAALERKQIRVSELPEDYIEISSGLGESSPRHVFVTPITHEDELKALIEFGSVHPISEEHMDFLNSIIGSIAVAINSAQSRVKLGEMLTTTQQQAKEMEKQQEKLKVVNESLEIQATELTQSQEVLQAQQEELRASNEELEEQAQALKASEESLQAQQEELRVTNEELAEQAKMLEKQKSGMEEQNQALEQAKVVLQEKTEDLEVSSKYKSEFLSTMSHELRTPLNSILILSNNLASNKKENLDEKQIEHCEVIHSAGSDLLSLINDILDLSKVEEGKLQLVLEDLPTEIIRRNIQLNFEHVAKERSLDFGVIIEEGLPETIRTDRQRLEQILKNLLSNAFKFTDNGGVYLEVTRPPEDMSLEGFENLDRDKSIALTVRDTGVGIPKDKQQLIFEAFQQADGTTSRKYGGTGLGLTISRELAKLLKGDLRLHKATEGEGSQFTLIIPDFVEDESAEFLDAVHAASETGEITRSSEPVEQAATNEPLAAVIQSKNHVLIIDDDEDFATLLKDLAVEHGLEATICLDGETGLENAKKDLPSAIILDIGLPGIDGFDVMEQLQLDESTKTIPVHFLSGSDNESKARSMGAFDFIKKPINQDQVTASFDKIQDALHKDVNRLLVVEDNEVAQQAIMAMFEEREIEVELAISGSDALDKIKKMSFDCMILDLDLPDMKGFELLELINTSDDYTPVPVIVYTAKDLMRDEEAALRKYADRIILKTDQSSERLLNEASLFLHWLGNRDTEAPVKSLEAIDHRDDIFEGKSVLVVDDDMRNIYSLSAILEERGFDIDVASNGIEALAALEEKPDYDLVLMDIMMPEMDGYEAMTEIRKQKRFADKPIIALTAKAMKGDKQKCIDAGANDYITKPIETDKLIALIRVWLQQ